MSIHRASQITDLLGAVAMLRADIVRDLHSDTRHAIAVSIPRGFEIAGWSLADAATNVVIVGGYRSKAAAAADAPTLIAEIAAKMANAVLRPGVDPPVCRLCAWTRIRVSA